MTGIRGDGSGRGVRQADALTGSDTEAITAPQQSLHLFFFHIWLFFATAERLISCRFSTERSFLFSATGLFLLSPAVSVSAAVCFPAGDHRRRPGLHHLPAGKEALRSRGMSCDRTLARISQGSAHSANRSPYFLSRCVIPFLSPWRLFKLLFFYHLMKCTCCFSAPFLNLTCFLPLCPSPVSSTSVFLSATR